MIKLPHIDPALHESGRHARPEPPRRSGQPVWLVAALAVVATLASAIAVVAVTTSTGSSARADQASPASPGPASFTVPHLIGLTGNQASAALSSAGFRAIDFEVNYAPMTSTVVSQSPQPGTSWSTTATVHLTLAPVHADPPATPASTAPTISAAPVPVATTPDVAPSSSYTYKITGKNRAMITYSASGGNTSQVSSATLPWRKTVDSPGYGSMSFAYVSAQNSGGGTISCQIIGPSGTVVSENTSEGEYAIVTCQN